MGLSAKPRSRRRGNQIAFAFRTHGGARPGSGRKPKPGRVPGSSLIPHRARPSLDARIPIHVTLRAVAKAPPFRTQVVGGIVFEEVRRASTKGFRILHFSIQDNHLHLVVEAEGAAALSSGMQRLGSRIARRLNLLNGRRGSLWRERYHRRDLTTPRQFRNALVYVIFNSRKHATGKTLAKRMTVLDGFSSAVWIEPLAWAPRSGLRETLEAARAGPPVVTSARSWIASTGWKRHGLLRPTEMPLSPG
jgi:putative transposase